MSDVETVVPEGYQKTKIGVIPSDWKVAFASEILERYSESVALEDDKTYREIGIRSHGKGIFHKDETTAKDIGNKRVFWIKPNTLVLNIVFAWERAVAITSEKEKGFIASHRFPMYEAKDNCNLDFLLRYLLNPRGNLELQLASPGGAGRNRTLGQEAFQKVRIPLPPLPEQQRIATILNTWDEAITKQANLIALKEQRKRGLMQQLLTGAVRFPGFDGEWEKHKLHKIEKMGMISLSRGKVISKIDMNNNPGNYPVYSSSTRNNGLFGYYNEYMFDEELINWSVDGGGHFFYRPRHKFSITNVAGILKVLSDKLSCQFLAYQLQLLHMSKRYDYSTKAHPSVIRHEYTIQIPSLAEQQKIAQVLSLADQEIDQLNKQLEALKEQKRGLMQKLLTGQVRVNVA